MFFGSLGSAHTFAAALRHTAPYAIGAFVLCAALSLLLPRTAVAEDVLLADAGEPQPADAALAAPRSWS